MSLTTHSIVATTVPADRRDLAVIDGRLSSSDYDILACSAVSSRRMSAEHMDLLYSRNLCEDRKRVLEHLHPKRLLKSVSKQASTIRHSSNTVLLWRRSVVERSHYHPSFFPPIPQTVRVVIMQGTTIATHYMNDQLKEDMARDELVSKGKLTRKEADEESEEWGEVRVSLLLVG